MTGPTEAREICLELKKLIDLHELIIPFHTLKRQPYTLNTMLNPAHFLKRVGIKQLNT
jgi:hypothetical protein